MRRTGREAPKPDGRAADGSCRRSRSRSNTRRTGRKAPKPGGRTTGERFGVPAVGRTVGGSGRERHRSGAPRRSTHPPRRAGVGREAGVRTGDGEPETVFGPESGRRATGSRGDEPHGREWPKHVTGLEEEQTVKVVRNGEGGPKRAGKPATRRRPEARVRAPADGCGRRAGSGEAASPEGEGASRNRTVVPADRGRDGGRAGKWTPRAGSVEGAENPMGEMFEASGPRS